MSGDTEYVPPSTQNPTPASRAIMLKKVASNVVTASQPDEERTLVGIPFGCASGSEGVSGSEKACDAESTHSTGSNDTTTLTSSSEGATVPDALANPASSDEAESSESTS